MIYRLQNKISIPVVTLGCIMFIVAHLPDSKSHATCECTDQGNSLALARLPRTDCAVDTITLTLWFEPLLDLYRPPYFIPADTLPSDKAYKSGVLYYPMYCPWRSD